MSRGEQFESLAPLEQGDIIEIDLESDEPLTHPIRVRSVIQSNSGGDCLLRLEDPQFKFLEQVDGEIRAITSELTIPVTHIIRRDDAVPEPQTQISE